MSVLSYTVRMKTVIYGKEHNQIKLSEDKTIVAPPE